jgi:hypothetical protein
MTVRYKTRRASRYVAGGTISSLAFSGSCLAEGARTIVRVSRFVARRAAPPAAPVAPAPAPAHETRAEYLARINAHPAPAPAPARKTLTARLEARTAKIQARTDGINAARR